MFLVLYRNAFRRYMPTCPQRYMILLQHIHYLCQLSLFCYPHKKFLRILFLNKIFTFRIWYFQSPRWFFFVLSEEGYESCSCLKLVNDCLKVPTPYSFLFLKKFIYLFIYFWLCWVFVAVRGLSLVVARGGYSSLQCADVSSRWLLLLWSTGSRHVGFSSCGVRAQ